MVISIVVAYAWGVLQLITLGSFARTVRIRTVYAALAVGLYLVVPLTVVLQASWTGLSHRCLACRPRNWSGSPPIPSIRSSKS